MEIYNILNLSYHIILLYNIIQYIIIILIYCFLSLNSNLELSSKQKYLNHFISHYMLGNSNSTNQPMRIGEALKSNQSITISEGENYDNTERISSFAPQIYLQKGDEGKLMNKYLLLCSEVERLSRLSQKQQTTIFNLTQQIQIKGTDYDGFRLREEILQKELKKLQEDDKQLLSKNHKLQQMLLQKNRLTSLLQEQLVMSRSKVQIVHKDTSDQKTIKIKELEQLLSNQRFKNNDLERQVKQALLISERAETRLNTKAENDRNLLINAENKIKDLQQQMRKYIAEKQRLQENQLRFRQQQIHLQTTKTFEYTKQVSQLQILNNDLMNQRHKTTEQIVELQKQLADTLSQLKIKVSDQSQYIKQISLLDKKIEGLNHALIEKETLVSQINMIKSDLEYKLQTTITQIKRLQGVYNQIQNQPCKSCHLLGNQNNVLNGKVRWLQELIQKKESEYKIVIQKSQKQLTNLRELLQSVNNLKGSNERVSRLLEVGTQKLIKASMSNKALYSTANLI